MGSDAILAYVDSNGNGKQDVGEPATSAGMRWTKPIGRYVALGDSIPYGHGLANPDKTTESGLPPNQGPSTLAYPSQLAANLGLTMTVRKSGCALEGDQAAVSGAASDRANTDSTTDDNCPNFRLGGFSFSTQPHKGVDQEELMAADLATHKPALVTLQVGADDINFTGCLTSELGIPSGIPGLVTIAHPESCVQGPSSNRHLSKDVNDDLRELGASLQRILAKIESAAPHASIVLVDYYQIIPRPSDTLYRDGSLVCNDLTLKNTAARTAIYHDAQLLQSGLNAVIQATAKAHHEVGFVDLGSVPDFADHAMCTAPDGGNPGPSSQARIFDGPTWRVAHPTALGQQAIAARIEADCASKFSCVGR
jgi:hypothetical protein